MMLRKFEKYMRKNVSRNNYSIDFKKSEDVDDEKFYKNERGSLVCDVVVCYKDEFEIMHNYIKELEHSIDEKNNTIKSLENDLANVDKSSPKVTENNNDDYIKKIDELNTTIKSKDDEIHELELNKTNEIATLKEEHLKEINTNDKTHHREITSIKDKANDKIDKIRSNYLALTIKNNRMDEMYIEELEELGLWAKFRGKDKAIYKEMKEKNRLKLDDEYIKGQIEN